MTYRYRVTLEGIKGFYRVYLVNATNSLYTLHKQLRADLEFPQDQQILFKAFDEADNVVGRFALMPLPGNKAVDEVPIAETVKAGIVRYQYFYDVSSKKYVIVTFEGLLSYQNGGEQRKLTAKAQWGFPRRIFSKGI